MYYLVVTRKSRIRSGDREKSSRGEARRWRVCFSLFAGVKLRPSLLVVSIHPFLLLIEFQEFPHENDTCYLAHCYPYSYTDLELYLRTMEDNPKTAQYVQKEVLAN